MRCAAIVVAVPYRTPAWDGLGDASPSSIGRLQSPVSGVRLSGRFQGCHGGWPKLDVCCRSVFVEVIDAAGAGDDHGVRRVGELPGEATCDGVTSRSAAISMTAGMSVTFGRES